jgi:hypothetical protein
MLSAMIPGIIKLIVRHIVPAATLGFFRVIAVLNILLSGGSAN